MQGNHLSARTFRKAGQDLDFSPVRPLLDFGSTKIKIINLFYYKKLILW